MELLVTMAIISLLLAMVLPNLGALVPSARLEGSGKQILRRLDYLRSEALIRGREMSLELDLDRARWRMILPADMRLTLDQDPQSLEEKWFEWNELEKGVKFAGVGDGRTGLAQSGIYRVRFDEYGFSSDQVIVLRLEDEPDEIWAIELRGLTGATSVHESRAGEIPDPPYVGEGAF